MLNFGFRLKTIRLLNDNFFFFRWQQIRQINTTWFWVNLCFCEPNRINFLHIKAVYEHFCDYKYSIREILLVIFMKKWPERIIWFASISAYYKLRIYGNIIQREKCQISFKYFILTIGNPTVSHLHNVIEDFNPRIGFYELKNSFSHIYFLDFLYVRSE